MMRPRVASVASALIQPSLKANSTPIAPPRTNRNRNQARRSSLRRKSTSVAAVIPMHSRMSREVPTRRASGRTAGAISTRPSGVIAAFAPTHAAETPRASRINDSSG